MAESIDETIDQAGEFTVTFFDHQRWLSLQMDNDAAVFVDAAFGAIEIADECVYFLKSTAETS